MKYLIVFFFSLIAAMSFGSAYAVSDYVWSVPYDATLKFDAPASACTASASYYSTVNNTSDFTCTGGSYTNATTYSMELTRDDGVILNINSLGTPIPCVAPQIWDNDLQACVDPPPQCTPPQVYDAAIGFCVTPPDCSGTVGDVVNGNVVPVGPGPASMCTGGCNYNVTDFVFTSTDYGYWRFTGDGASCSGPTAPPQSDPPPPEDPITPTDPTPPVTDDGNPDAEPATDENQEQMSQQLEGIQNQLQNLEQGSANETNAQNTTNDLLSQLLNEARGTGDSGTGTGDQDGNGTDDFFADGACVTPPACDGPAIECAIAQQAYSTRCNLQDETQDITETDVMASVGATQTLEQYFDPSDPANTIDLTGSFTAPAETTSACPADYAVVTRFGSFNISYSYICDFGNTVRPVVLLAAWIISGLMFYGSLMRDW